MQPVQRIRLVSWGDALRGWAREHRNGLVSGPLEAPRPESGDEFGRAPARGGGVAVGDVDAGSGLLFGYLEPLCLVEDARTCWR